MGESPDCPNCRNKMSEIDRLPTENTKHKMKCEGCHRTIKYSTLASHSLKCKKLKAKEKEEVKSHVFKDAKPSVNRETFKCPACSEKNLARENLVKHFTENHRGQTGVCPICAVQEYGDPNYVSTNLAGHLEQRHSFDLGEFTMYQLSDDAIMQ